MLLLAEAIGAVVLGGDEALMIREASSRSRRSSSRIGVLGVLARRNALILVFMCVELMLNAVNLSVRGAGHAVHGVGGQVFVCS
ncbi:MAG: NADH-quinone oxidoreductase subunit K [Gemmatimonadaceae bacterium]|nr:NADH-quinone oxidoreductase subunit K [Gemmatimonadaceae bacterium]